MNYKFDSINTSLKTGNEDFIYESKSVVAKLVDFWRWSVSDLVSNATRGRLAEFIVAMALGVDTKTPRDEWQRYDLTTPDGLKIEVKSASYMQSWAQKEESKISFSIKPSLYWDRETNKQGKKKEIHADVYIFCLLIPRTKDNINPLDLNQWDFYVLSAKEVKGYKRSKHSITLKSLQKLTRAVKFDEILHESQIKRTNNYD